MRNFSLTFIFFFILGAFAWQPAPSPDVAWISLDGEMWLGSEGITPRVLDLPEKACCPQFSADGSHLAILSDNQETLFWLEMANSDDVMSIALPTPTENEILRLPIWQGTDAIWLNIIDRLPQSGLVSIESSLWQVDLANMLIEVVEGNFVYPSSDGTFVAIVETGEYEGDDTVVTLFDEGLVPLQEWSFASVSSGTHAPWVPNIQWRDGVAYTIIPPADLLYQFEAPQPSRLVRLSPQEGITELDEILSAYPAQGAWSADASQIAYLSPLDVSKNSQSLTVYDLVSGEQTRVMDTLQSGAFIYDWGILQLVDQTLVLWNNALNIEMFPDVFGWARMRNGNLVIHTNNQLITTDGQVIADDVDNFDNVLVGGID